MQASEQVNKPFISEQKLQCALFTGKREDERGR